MRNDLEILGEFSVYPGHPVTIAYLITKLYHNYEEAAKRTEYGFPVALGDNRIPGAGGNVYTALSLLEYLKNGTFCKRAEDKGLSIWGTALAWADEQWASCDSQAKGGYNTKNPDYYIKRCQEGQQQADKFKPLLKEQETWWEG